MEKPFDWIELRPDHDGHFDEVAATDCNVFIETISKDGVFLELSRGERSGHRGVAIWIRTENGRLVYSYEIRQPRERDDGR